jgi:hypothetical protein
MNSSTLLTNSAIISFIFLLFKFIEMRFIIKQNKPFKILFKESLSVYFSVLVGLYLIEQLMPLKIVNYESTKVFVGSPEF